MRFTCNQKQVAPLVQIVERATGTSSTQPILTGILIEAEDGNLQLSATDLHQSVQCSLPAEVDKPGKIVVEGKYLANALRRIAPGDVTFEVTNNVMEIRGGYANIAINTMPSDDFPELPASPTAGSLQLPVAVLVRMIEQTGFIPIAGEAQVFLRGVLFEHSHNLVRMVATDGNRLALRIHELDTGPATEGDDPDTTTAVIIDGSDLRDVSRALTAMPFETVRVDTDSNHISFTGDRLRITCRLLDGQFPNYNRVLPDGCDTEVRLDRTDFLSAVERASVINDEPEAAIIIEAHEGILILRSQETQVGKASDQLEIEQEGPDFCTAYQARYIVQGLNAIGGERVLLRVQSGLNPGVLQPLEEENYKYVMMPVRLSALGIE